MESVGVVYGMQPPVYKPVLARPQQQQVTLVDKTTLECPHCHTKQDLKTVYDAWIKVYESSFLFLWLHRLARKGGRNLVGDALDGLIPVPASWRTKLKKQLGPTMKYYRKRCLDYEEITKLLLKRKRVRFFSDYFLKTVINLRILGTIGRFYEGQIFLGMARLILMGITFYDVGKYAYRAHQYPKERQKNLKLCLRQGIKWTIGTEIGNIGFDIGLALTKGKQHTFVTAFLLESLISASFDKVLQKYFSKA